MQARFAKLDLLVDPQAVVWYEEQCGNNLEGAVRAEQLSRWYGVQWMPSAHRALGEARSQGAHAMLAYLDLVARAIEVYGFGKHQQARMLGHLLMGSTGTAKTPGLVEAIVAKVGHVLSPDVDVALVALCSGYPFHGVRGEASAVQDVYGIAQQFTAAHGNRELLNNAALSGGGYTAMMLSSMPRFNDWEGLYEAVQSLALFSCEASLVLDTPVDGDVFHGFSPT